MKISINEQDILNMVKRVLREYHKGQQLMLPFDGNDEPYNYMQFIEYIENIGTYGTINKPAKSFEECINNPELLEKCGIASLHMNPWNGFDAWLVNNFLKSIEDEYGTGIYSEEFSPADTYEYDDSLFENMPDEEFLNIFKNRKLISQELIKRGREALRIFYNDCTTNELGQIYCERVIDLPKLLERFSVNGQDFYQTVSKEFSGIGDCWTWSNGAGESYNTMIINGTNVSLKGWVNPENVDWEACIELENMDEYELRLYSNIPVQIDEIEVIEGNNRGKRLPLKGSIVVRT